MTFRRIWWLLPLAIAVGIFAIGGIFVPAPASALENDKESVCGQKFKTVKNLFKRLRDTEGFTKPAPHGYYLVMSEPANKSIWTFTIPGHPAHPTVVCRRPVTEGDQISITMDMVCGGSQEDCDKLAAAFRKLNEKIRDRLSAQAAKETKAE